MLSPEGGAVQKGRGKMPDFRNGPWYECAMKTILFLSMLGLNQPALAIRPPETRKEAIAMMADAAKDYASAQASYTRGSQAAFRLASLARQGGEALKASLAAQEKMIREGAPAAALLEANRRMQETQMSFNLQYLQLQSQMQHENRSYTAISNIMKTKHDTVKNSISNIR